MSAFFGRLGDRLLSRLVPGGSALAVKCQCRCTDKCYPCCPQVVEGETVIVCRPELSCTP